MMRYRRLGRTGLNVSVIGFGTCQLRMVPEQRAIDALKRGFALGVNIVHTAPDYAGADDLVAEAIHASGREVIVCTQGYGDRALFEHFFETASSKYRKKKLEMFGIACIEDREKLGENVWGPGGIIEFLQRKKREGRLLGTFCSTHGTPEYIRRLVESNEFDAILLAYNPAGYHLLSYNPEPPVQAECLARNSDLFSIFAQRDVGLMLMKPLAGGMLCRGKAIKPHHAISTGLIARDVLRFLLVRHPEVACVMPGTNSEAEAEENAMAGHDPLEADLDASRRIDAAIHKMRRVVCSRCGKCDSLCSQHLPISWLFRAAYIDNYRSMPFETLPQLRYFALHPGQELKCSSCIHRSCQCPSGIDIPASLGEIHEQMKEFRALGVPSQTNDTTDPSATYAARLVSGEWASHLSAGRTYEFRLAVDNIGQQGWHYAPGHPQVSLEARWDPLEMSPWKRSLCSVTNGFPLPTEARMRGDIPQGERGYFVLEMCAPRIKASYRLGFHLGFWLNGKLLERHFLGQWHLMIR